MTHLLATFNVLRAVAQWHATEDLPSAILAAGAALSPSLLAAQVLPQRAPDVLVSADALVPRVAANRQDAFDLFKPPLRL